MNLNDVLRRNARRLACLMAFITITISIIKLSEHGEIFSTEQICNKDSAVMMEREFETFAEQHLRGKPIHMAKKDNDNVIAIANGIARKYIPVDCELSKVMTGLVNAGFKVSDISQLKLPTLRTSIFLRKWYDIFPVEFRLKIEHQAGRIKLVTVSIHHYFF